MSNHPHTPTSIEDQLAEAHRQNFLLGEQLRKALESNAALYTENKQLKEAANDGR